MRPSERQSSSKILVVDDNPGVLKILGTLFEEQGMHVTLAESVAAARAALEADAWSFDLVLSDISMPKETGFDLLTWIKRDGSPKPDLPVLLTTAQMPEAENRVKGLALGAVDYVVRPIELSELVIRTVHAIENFQRVRSLEASLQDSEKLANVGRLLAASHHEIKNIATLIQLASHQATKFVALGRAADGERALAAVSQGAALLTDISLNVANLLDPSASPSRPLELTRLVRDTLELLQPRVKPYFLAVDAPQSAWVLGHAPRVKQVLINLVLNARDAIAELAAEGTGMIKVSISAQGDGFCLAVVDDGIGFAAGERSAFEPFATTKKLRGGQGLGLWLCATLAQNMGGRLSLCSAGVGEGAEARLWLPAGVASDDLDIEKYLVDVD